VAYRFSSLFGLNFLKRFFSDSAIGQRVNAEIVKRAPHSQNSIVTTFLEWSKA